MEKRENTAILLLYCPDQQGIITEITRFIADNRGNIVYLDQYVDRHDGVFFMRIEWELEGFTIPRDKINDYIDTLYAKRYGMTYYLYFTDQKPRMALFVSKMSHCLYDLLARYKAGELDCDIPCIVSNHEDLRYVADQFGIPYYVWSIKKRPFQQARSRRGRDGADAPRRHHLHSPGPLYANRHRGYDQSLPQPYHQYPPQFPASIRWSQALPSGLAERGEDHRCYQPLCDDRT